MRRRVLRPGDPDHLLPPHDIQLGADGILEGFFVVAKKIKIKMKVNPIDTFASYIKFYFVNNTYCPGY